jgi:hypothetical protein
MMKHEYKGVKHSGLDSYLRDLLKCTEKTEEHVCSATNAIHSSGWLYPDFEAAIRQHLNRKKGK